MASAAGWPSSTRSAPLQTAWAALAARLGTARDGLERWLEAERDQLPLWIPVMIGAGVTAWFALPTADEWRAAALGGLALAAFGVALSRGGRAGLCLAIAGFALASGVGLAWWRAERVALPVLQRPATVRLEAVVERVEPLPARDIVRLRLSSIRVLPAEPNPGQAEGSDRPPPAMPPHVRVNVATADAPAGLVPGTRLRLGARLSPPQVAGVPGAYSYQRLAWYDGIGASGKAYPPVTMLSRPAVSNGGIRAALTQHIERALPGGAGGVAAAFVTGDVGAISTDDNVAMRRAGLTHLLSISGLHITVAVAAAMLLTIRLLALSPFLALRFRLPMIAAGVGAAAAIGYTLLSGAEVPTIRSCVAALLVLAALAMGREAVTLRLVAAGATAVLLAWPEAMTGPSFQLSFAAVTAIVALHEHPRVRGWLLKRDEAWWRKAAREGASLLLTGVLVEAALMPISVFHFHQAGFYGSVANIVAIPLSTFVIMPAEALALLLDVAGLGAPAWWVAGRAIRLLLWIARRVAATPGAMVILPTMPTAAFALMVVGGLWLALWRTRWRRLGLAPLAVGAGWALAAPPPDLLVTGDGKHIAVRTTDGGVAMLRDQAHDYTRSMLTVNAGVDGDPELIVDQPDARCSRDTCLATRTVGGRQWRVLATRSGFTLPRDDLTKACAAADIVVSDRRLPKDCRPRWLLLTPRELRRSGGLAITFATGRVATVLTPGDEHPWARAAALSHTDAGGRRAGPGRALDRARNAADHKRDWRGRAGSSRPRDGNI